MKNILKNAKRIIFLISSVILLSSCNDYSRYPHIGDEVEVLKFYRVKATAVSFNDSIRIIDDKGNEANREYNNYFFVSVDINLKVNNSDDAKSHKLDKNDFKLKNHVGSKLSNYDLFSPIESFEDFSWCNQTILKGEEKSFTINFQFSKNVNLKDCLFALEVDFSNALGNHKDIVLSTNADSFKQKEISL